MQTIRQWLNNWLEISKIPKSKHQSVVKALRANFEELEDLTRPIDELPSKLISELRAKIDETSRILRQPGYRLKHGTNRLKNGLTIWVDRKTDPDGDDDKDDDDDDDDCDR